jgi:CBS domain-containing protein
MLANELMTSPVVTVTADVPIREAVRMLDRHDICSMPVLDGAGSLVGMVSETDLLRGGIVDDPRAHTRPHGSWSERPPQVVGDVMSVSVVSVVEHTDAAVVARTLLDLGLRAVPVVRGSEVVGIVSRRDLVRALAATDDQILQEVEALFVSAELTGWTAEVVEGVVVLAGSGPARERAIATTIARTVRGVTEVRTAEGAPLDSIGASRVEAAPSE